MLIKPDLTDLNELIQASATISRHYLKEIEMCAIYPAKIGNCSGTVPFVLNLLITIVKLYPFTSRAR